MIIKRGSKKFLELQNEWYKKLKDSGFEDIEWYDYKTGIGLGSPYLKSGRNLTVGELKKRYSTELQNHYRLARNFLTHGPFYLNFTEKFAQTVENSTTYRSFASFLTYKDQYYTLAESIVWEMYCEGFTLQETSDELRRLYQSDAIPKPNNAANQWKTSLPYSIFWVTTVLKRLRANCIMFNLTHPEGLLDLDEADRGATTATTATKATSGATQANEAEQQLEALYEAANEIMQLMESNGHILELTQAEADEEDQWS